MTLFQTIMSTIDMRSFSNAWYWIVLVIAWSGLTSNLLGVPNDMLWRARRGEGDAMIDLETIALLHARRRMRLMKHSGPFSVALWIGVCTTSIILGFVYWLEMGQAISLLIVPMVIAVLSGQRLSRRIAEGTLGGLDLVKALRRHRTMVSFFGLFAISITTLWGMFFNVVMPVLGR